MFFFCNIFFLYSDCYSNDSKKKVQKWNHCIDMILFSTDGNCVAKKNVVRKKKN